ncbi:MAG TPA: hypothetical protein VIH42_15590 [Thermoguttaceae bacterium]
MRNDPSVIIRLEGDGRVYQPGEMLSGDYVFESLTASQIKALEISVLWYTEGKGEEDLAVHAFWRLDPDSGDVIDPQQPSRFETVLPNTPLSYDGVIVKVRWCVRVRAFIHRGREVFAQKDFRLGDLPAIKSEAED